MEASFILASPVSLPFWCLIFSTFFSWFFTAPLPLDPEAWLLKHREIWSSKTHLEVIHVTWADILLAKPVTLATSNFKEVSLSFIFSWANLWQQFISRSGDMLPEDHLRPWDPGWRSSPYMRHRPSHDRWKRKFADWRNGSHVSAQKSHTSLTLLGQDESHGLYLISEKYNPPIGRGTTGHMSKPDGKGSEV